MIGRRLLSLRLVHGQQSTWHHYQLFEPEKRKKDKEKISFSFSKWIAKQWN